jgi:hypothetical protein
MYCVCYLVLIPAAIDVEQTFAVNLLPLLLLKPKADGFYRTYCCVEIK